MDMSSLPSQPTPQTIAMAALLQAAMKAESVVELLQVSQNAGYMAATQPAAGMKIMEPEDE